MKNAEMSVITFEAADILTTSDGVNNTSYQQILSMTHAEAKPYADAIVDYMDNHSCYYFYKEDGKMRLLNGSTSGHEHWVVSELASSWLYGGSELVNNNGFYTVDWKGDDDDEMYITGHCNQSHIFN